MIQVDLPMPKACKTCEFDYDFIYCRAMDDETWGKYEDDWNLNVCKRNDRPNYCPLIEVKENDPD